ncbi:MFS transporter [Paenibacillus mesotrionivorans]|uniref:MFS transporter n=1 Tax=Paenibacillus mesotrionivorans TaxID=3160968 RepID=A0ACC7NTS2_9BACL
MKTAIWLYLFMFVAFFDLHAQYPILSPFAVSLGAAPSFIGLILGLYSITHLPGNLLAGVGVDRYGSKVFICISLMAGGILLLLQAQVENPWQLLVIRSVSGFVLAFLSPACMTLLAKLARDRVHQSKLMSGNGLVHTLASVVSPAAGAYLVAKIGFSTSFTVLGWGLVVTGILAIFGIRDVPIQAGESLSTAAGKGGHTGHTGHGHHTGHGVHTGKSGSGAAGVKQSASSGQTSGLPWLFFMLPMAISCSQGILYFELPMLNHHGHGHASATELTGAVLNSGMLFSLVSLGALLSLSMVFLNRVSPLLRTMAGCLMLAAAFFAMAVHAPVSLYVLLFFIGMAKGVIFPAIASLLAASTSSTRYGRAYSILSIAYSLGSFIGPVAAGQWRGVVSPYFIAFSVLMAGLCFLPLDRLHWQSAKLEPPGP